MLDFFQMINLKLTLPNLLRALYFLLLAGGTVWILLRRWCWDQVATQVSAPVLYATLLVNCYWLALLIRRWARSGALTKTGRN